LEFGNVGFSGGRKPDYPEKTHGARQEPRTNLTHIYKTLDRNQTRATLVGGEGSHRCAILAPQLLAWRDHNAVKVLINWSHKTLGFNVVV